MARLKGFQKLTPIDKAVQKFFDMLQVKRSKSLTVHLRSALNRVLAEDVIAKDDVPRFSRSAMDGYAVRAKNTFEASLFTPKILKITDGEGVGEKQANHIWTGNPIPKGADAVVMLENTKIVHDKIEVWVPVTPGENVSKRGEDVQKGEIAVKAGTRLKPQHLGLIAALGVTEVRVVDKPKIAILATGNELVEIGGEPQENQVIEVNKLILSSLCRELGAEPLDLGVVRDEISEIVEKLKRGTEKADVVITTGGTSVGRSDLVPAAVDQIGEPGVVVHGVAMRPAMPTALAVIDKTPIIILSGNPVAAMIGFEVFAKPLINRMLGLKETFKPVVEAKITRRISAVLGRKTFIRVRVSRRDGEFFAEPISTKGSSVISTVTKAHGYIIVPENREGLEKGETVIVHLFNV